MALTATEILNAQDVKVIPLDVPEWGGSIFIRTLTGAERDTVEILLREFTKNKAKHWRAEFAALVISNESGSRLFENGQIKPLGEKSGNAIERIADAGLELNRLTDEALKAEEKNSESDQSEESGSA